MFATEGLSPFARARVVVLGGGGCGAEETRPSCIDQTLTSLRTKDAAKRAAAPQIEPRVT